MRKEPIVPISFHREDVVRRISHSLGGKAKRSCAPEWAAPCPAAKSAFWGLIAGFFVVAAVVLAVQASGAFKLPADFHGLQPSRKSPASAASDTAKNAPGSNSIAAAPAVATR